MSEALFILVVLILGLLLSVVPFWLQTLHFRRSKSPIRLKYSQKSCLEDAATGRPVYGLKRVEISSEVNAAVEFTANGFLCNDQGKYYT